MLKKIFSALMLVVLMAGCSATTPQNSYTKWLEERPRAWGGIDNREEGHDFRMWELRKRCESIYGLECLEYDIWGNRNPYRKPKQPVVNNLYTPKIEMREVCFEKSTGSTEMKCFVQKCKIWSSGMKECTRHE